MMKTSRMLVLFTLATALVVLPCATSPSRVQAAPPQASRMMPGGVPFELAPAASLENAWFSLGIGLNNQVEAIVEDGDYIYVGGNFNSAGGMAGADHVARWNGFAWQALAPGLNNSVMAIAVLGTDVYVGGAFTKVPGSGVANHIARWNGSSWQSLGDGLNSHVYALAKIGTDLYVGGNFTNAGGIVGANYIARWDGSAWHAVGNGLNNYVLSLAAIGTSLYAAGGFLDAGGVSNADHIARLDGSSWHALGTGMNDVTQELAVNGSDLYASGNFTNAGGVSGANFFARWDGSDWHAIGGNPPVGISGIGFAGTNIYVVTYQRPYWWNGSTWQVLDPAFSGHSLALAVTEKGVYIGGSFTDLAGNPNADNISLWQAKHLLPDSIVYSRNASGPVREIRVVDANGSNDQLLFSGTFPRLSPSRNQIAFLRPGSLSLYPNFGYDLYVRNLATGAESLVFDNYDYLVGFDWMSDNLHIVFDFANRIARIHADGTGYEDLVVTGPDHPGYNDAPSFNGWNPNQAFAFHNAYVGILTCDKYGDIYGGAITPVPNTLPHDFWPAWSPDGQWIAFVRLSSDDPYGGGNYIKVHPNGSGLTQLTFLNGNASLHLHGVGTWDSQKDHIVAPGTVNGQAGMYAIATDGSGSIMRISAPYGAQADFVGAVIGDVKSWLYLPAIFR